MAEGYVYILHNPELEGIIKIGKTTKSSESRAAEISKGTGVPVAYRVAFEEFVSDCIAVEKEMHKRFSMCRVNPRREFFRVPLKEAIKALQQLAQRYQTTSARATDYATTQATEIFPELRELYPQYLRPEITSVKIVQKEHVCFLEVTSTVHPNLRDETIERIDLEFISEHERPMFDVNHSTKANADKFMTLDPYSIVMCTPLFTKAACESVAAEFEDRRPKC